MISGEHKKLNKIKITESHEKIQRKQSKLSCQKDPGNWRVYRRLLDDKSVDFECLGPRRSTPLKKEIVIGESTPTCPVLNFPHQDGLRCMCFENVMKIIQRVCRNKPQTQNKIAPAKPSDSWTRFCKKKYKQNEETQLPLATVVVRWQLKRRLPGYDHSTLHLILSRYGALRELRMISPNSAIAVFDELTSACNVINSHILGDPNNRLHCRWWHRAMENKSVYFNRKRIRVQKDPFLQH